MVSRNVGGKVTAATKSPYNDVPSRVNNTIDTITSEDIGFQNQKSSKTSSTKGKADKLVFSGDKTPGNEPKKKAFEGIHQRGVSETSVDQSLLDKTDENASAIMLSDLSNEDSPED